MHDSSDRPPPSSTEAPPSSTSNFPPDVLDRYVRIKALGLGAMGEIHLCQDTLIGREVAMKVLRGRARRDPDARRRFVREAHVHAMLEHPAIVPVYDLGYSGDELRYFTMKRIRGETLEAVLDAQRGGDIEALRRFGRRRLLVAFNQVCLAIEFAHARGVVHRDLKPANIMLGEFGEVNVLDWGVARVSADDVRMSLDDAAAFVATAGPAETNADIVFGTLGYMSPEELRGDEVDGRSDVFGLGAILFEILTQQRLIEGEQASILTQTLHGVEARPSVRAPDFTVPLELEAVILKATAVDPSERYQTARELSEAIERYLDGDRDGRFRRQLAENHLARARAARGTNGRMTDVIREASKAAAIDPSSREAVDMLVTVVTDTQTPSPDELKEYWAQAAERREQGRKTNSTVYLAMLLVLPAALWMGITSLPLFIALATFIAITLGVTVLTIRQREKSFGIDALQTVLSYLSLVPLSFFFGPFILLPTVALASFLMGNVNGARSSSTRRLDLALLFATLIVPLGLEGLGVLPQSMRFLENEIALMPRMTAFPPIATMVVLLATSLLAMMVPAYVSTKHVESLEAADLRIFLQAKRLAAVLPTAVHAASSEEAPPQPELALSGPR